MQLIPQDFMCSRDLFVSEELESPSLSSRLPVLQPNLSLDLTFHYYCLPPWCINMHWQMDNSSSSYSDKGADKGREFFRLSDLSTGLCWLTVHLWLPRNRIIKGYFQAFYHHDLPSVLPGMSSPGSLLHSHISELDEKSGSHSTNSIRRSPRYPA